MRFKARRTNKKGPVRQCTQKAERQGIGQPVNHQRAAGSVLEFVHVAPGAVGTGELHVNEAHRRLEGFDAGSPAHGDAA